MAQPKSEKWWAAIRKRGLSEKFLASVRTPEYREAAGLRHLVHGHAPMHGPKSPTYQSWLSMRSRVTNPNRREWAWYGGRGITCDPRWKLFVNFLADMGVRPEGTSIDRIDPDGNYELANCRWATKAQHLENKRHGGRYRHIVVP